MGANHSLTLSAIRQNDALRLQPCTNQQIKNNSEAFGPPLSAAWSLLTGTIDSTHLQ
jgi:hypothetical protein